MFHNIRWRIAIPYIILILLVMGTLALYLSNLVRQAYLDDLRAQLTAEARLLAGVLEPALVHHPILDSQAHDYANSLGARVTIIAPDGTVLGESHEDRTKMENHLGRPEVQQALRQGQGSSIRFSYTVGYDMMYVAVPVEREGHVIGIVRLALPLRQIEGHVSRLRQAILFVALITAVLAGLLAILIAERTARPIRQLTRVAERLAEGDLSARLFSTTRDEIGELTSTINYMADQLREKMMNLAEEQSRLAGVLDHMADGALITDGRGRVRLINPAGSRLLRLAPGEAIGRPFAQVARHHRLIELWQNCRERGEEQTDLVELDRQGPFLQAIVTPLREAEPQSCLVILQDLTQVRRLETVRRDFISNISHELRTPLASLKALVETLRDGALEDPPAAQRFLNRIEAEVDALSQMVQELLELSRLEAGQMPFHMVPTEVADIIIPPVERLRPMAERAGLQLTVNLPAGLPKVLADAERIGQVVTNLVHNAIKFTPPGGMVEVSAQLQGTEVVIAVRDTGVGIPADALPRIFERFYKADRARAGGGTGLGLSIAKHIVQTHGGRIWAESVEGRGSTFYFSLPAVNPTLTKH